MRRAYGALLAGCLTLASCGPATPEPIGELGHAALGQAPLCEASALAHDPWNAGHFLVADDEDASRLFTFRLEAGRLVMPLGVPLPGEGPRDIEALAPDGAALWVVGSSALRRDCTHDPERDRIVSVRSEGAALVALERLSIADAAWRSDVARCVADRFTMPPPADAEALCTQIALGEAACVPGAGGDAFAIEGAVVHEGRLWLGLRAPRLEGDALLLRVTPGEHRFDAIARLTSTGGVRDLTLSDEGTVLAITGEGDLLSLVHFPAHALQDGMRITAASLRSLRGGSEGIALDGDAALVVTDGTRGADPARCEDASLQQRALLETP